MEKKQLALVGIIIILVLILLIGGIYFFITKNNTKESEIIHRAVNQSGDGLNVNINADNEVASSCGGINCFKDKFKDCKKATLTSQMTNNIIYHYEILGAKDGLCEVKSSFVANPNPDWVGKEMTCKYDNTNDFEIAIQDTSNCQGALYDLMTNV